jgi:hypothetical protein
MTPDAYPGYGLEANFCRNPDASNTIWCYTNDPDTSWDYCDPIGSFFSECPDGWVLTGDGICQEPCPLGWEDTGNGVCLEPCPDGYTR